MGLIKAAVGAIGSTLHDQWKEAIRCEDMGNDILMMKKTTPTGVITNKSTVIVGPGQCAIIYDNGRGYFGQHRTVINALGFDTHGDTVYFSDIDTYMSRLPQDNTRSKIINLCNRHPGVCCLIELVGADIKLPVSCD